jgi:hypothetical protein
MSYFNKATLVNFFAYLETLCIPNHIGETLVALIEASPNPEVAHEMASGIYEQPNLARETKLGTLTSYDAFKAQVTYTQLYQEKRYFSDKENADLFISRTHSSMDVHVKALGRNEPIGRFTIPATGWVSRVETCTVEKWQSATIADEPKEGLMAPDCERCYQGYDDCPCGD